MSEPSHWSKTLLNDDGEDLIYEVEGDEFRGNPLDIVTVVTCHDAEPLDGMKFEGKATALEMKKRWNELAGVSGPDDDEPVTIDWLKSVGWKVYVHFPSIEIAGGHLLEWRMAGMWIGETPIALTLTRGQVRRLLAAMGVDRMPGEQEVKGGAG